MKNIDLGKTGMKVSVIGLGTWAIGGGPAWGGDMDTQVSIDTICEAAKAGINLLDTAPGYNFGNSETVVGKALKHLKREDIILETKCGIVWDRKGSLFNKVGDRQLYKNLSPESIREEINKSLERLEIDYIDIYMKVCGNAPYVNTTNNTLNPGKPMNVEATKEFIKIVAIELGLVVDDDDLSDITQERWDRIYQSALERAIDTIKFNEQNNPDVQGNPTVYDE